MSAVPAAARVSVELPDWLGFLLQSNDSFYPTGSYAHSFGVEGLIQEGLLTNRDTLREFIFASVIPSLRHNELPLAAQARRAFEQTNWDEVGELSILSSALKAAREVRVASENIGRQRAELCTRLFPDSAAEIYLEKARSADWPFSSAISAALEGWIHSAPIEATLVSIYYSTIAAVLAAAMKLLRIGQNGAQTLLAEALAALPAAVAGAMETQVDQIGWFNPWLDIAAARHETAESRLFIS